MAEGKAKPLEIAGSRIRPGRRERIDLPVARLPTGSWSHIPLEVVVGSAPGPTLWLSGAIHGDEVLGVEIIRGVLTRIDATRLSGRILAAPIVNAFGFIEESRYLPDRRDLNRSFPGSARGSLAARIAHLFMTEVVTRSDYGIDLHCGSDDRVNLPQIRADLDDEDTLRCAVAFDVPVMLHSKPPAGSLRHAARKVGAHVLVYEAGEARRIDRAALDAGIRGTLRVMREIGMLPGVQEPPSGTVEVRETRWVRAGRAGILEMEAGLGDRVGKGGRIGVIRDALGDDGLDVKSTRSGVVIGVVANPVVFQGEAIAHVAVVEDDAGPEGWPATEHRARAPDAEEAGADEGETDEGDGAGDPD